MNKYPEAFLEFKKKHYIFFLGCGVDDEFIYTVWKFTNEEIKNKIDEISNSLEQDITFLEEALK